MNRKGYASIILVVALISIIPMVVQGQDATPLISEPVQEAAETILDQALTFIDSASTYLGRGVLYVLNLITKDRVSADLAKPIGYLATITLILILFGLIDVAKRIIWLGIIVGWVLLVIRIVLDAIGA